MLIGIIIGLALLMFLCMRGWSILVAGPLCALLVAFTGGLPLLPSYLETFMGGTVGYVKNFFPMFFTRCYFW